MTCNPLPLDVLLIIQKVLKRAEKSPLPLPVEILTIIQKVLEKDEKYLDEQYLIGFIECMKKLIE